MRACMRVCVACVRARACVRACVRVCVCVCVCDLVFITSWGPNVPTRIVIPVNLYLVGTFLVPMRKQAYKSYSINFFENLKMQNVSCEG